jgi:hypothetical protein
MKRALLVSGVLLAAAALTPAKAHVTQLDDPLHGQCNAGCLPDNGTNTPITVNSPVNFGFASSQPGSSGTLVLDFLIPDTASAISASISITGSATTSATLFSMTPWTSGALDAYLGISASPNTPIGAYLPSTQTFVPTATGFFVFQANFGSFTLNGPGAPLADTFSASAIPKGSYIVAFLNGDVATANSGALFETASAAPEPSTWAMMLVGFAGLGFVFRQSRRKVAMA